MWGDLRTTGRWSPSPSAGQPQGGLYFYSSLDKSGSFRPIAPKLAGRMVLVVSYHAHQAVSRCVERPRNESRLLFSGFVPRYLPGKRCEGDGARRACTSHGGPQSLRTASPCDQRSGSGEHLNAQERGFRGRGCLRRAQGSNSCPETVLVSARQRSVSRQWPKIP